MSDTVREHLENHPNVQEFARNMGLSTAHVADALARMAKTLQDHQDAIEAAQAAMLDALEAARQHPSGRTAQRSPYDVGSRH